MSIEAMKQALELNDWARWALTNQSGKTWWDEIAARKADEVKDILSQAIEQAEKNEPRGGDAI